MISLTSLSAKQDIPVLPTSQKLALIVFYRPEYCQGLANLYSKSDELIKSLTFELKKAMKDILEHTQSTLKQRGFLRGSVVMGSNVYKLVDMIVDQGSSSCFCQYFLRYHCMQNTQGFKDEDLISFYNKIIDLWSQNKKSQMEWLNLQFKLIEPEQNISLVTQNIIKQTQIQHYQQQNYTIYQSINCQRQKSPISNQFQHNIKPSSNASLQFLKQFTSDLRPVDSIILQNINYKKITKTIQVLDCQEPSLNFQYYDDIGKVLFDIFLVAFDYSQIKVKQCEF